MKIGIVVQARMSSARLPGKVLHPVHGKPLIQYLLERLERCTFPHSLVVATSEESSDNPIAQFCQSRNISCYRGSLHNVADRFHQVIETYQFDGVVRVNGDSPLLDPQLIEKGVVLFCDHQADLVTNVYPRSYPPGQSVEVIQAFAFQAAYSLMQEAADLEHVTPFFYRNSSQFKLINFAAEQNYSRTHLAIDTPVDLQNFTTLISHMNRDHWEYNWLDLVTLLESLNPSDKVQ